MSEKPSVEKVELVLVICDKYCAHKLFEFVSEKILGFKKKETTLIKIVLGDTPRQSLSDKFDPKDVSWILFFREDAMMGQCLHEIKEIWGDKVFYKIVESFTAFQKEMANPKSEKLDLPMVDVLCHCPGKDLCCGLRKYEE